MTRGDFTPAGAGTVLAPRTYGEGDRPPRGDYSRARADFCCTQDWAAYSEADHALYRRLHARQSRLLPGRACDAFLQAVRRLGTPDRIPRFDTISEDLESATGWRLVAVPGLIPEEAFFRLLAARRFPVTDWIRRPDEFDYIVEPDLFHDLFGHVPLLFEPVFADFMQAYGEGGLKAARLGACELLARLYWYTVEFGLIATPSGPRAYGAGLLSSGGELEHAVSASGPRRLAFDPARMMRSRYRIDSYQPTYFVIGSFEELFEACAPDFSALYAAVRETISRNGEIAAGAEAPGDRATSAT
ncbi:phenylalanine 4-monooxygenase [Rubrivivax gelatinosus]|uniref:Phenylalanine-4-hydroxylase n=1 Tax=Rubrivivax gelatinosus TaxID=28068 RepID=A0A4R2M3Z4_RUBGE|nr:phenylalanine 4-monooxygenase [Rubrivivax gelatinosus]MBK1688453.1 phenylalanine 4-monooxygenase [Rubrivivax gelatinosus]TCP00751.1 phenylalanine 4-hydroxylase [Rubrivivax gelatinosus]